MAGLFIMGLTYYLLASLAIDLGYHRMLSHGAFKLPKWLSYSIITLGLPAGTPVQWAGNHRSHHAHTDKPGDPHSPVISGFWYAHVGWYLGTINPLICLLYCLAGPLRTIFDSFWRPRTNQQYNALAKDIAKDPYYSWISKPTPYMVAMWLHVEITFGIAYLLAGLSGILTMWLLIAFVYNTCDAVDSIAHMYGDKLPYQKSEARNNPILSWITLGSAWHANHHAFPKSAKHGFLKGQIDLAWMIIRLLEKANISRDVSVCHPETSLKPIGAT